jgi:hypothetical protein
MQRRTVRIDASAQEVSLTEVAETCPVQLGRRSRERRAPDVGETFKEQAALQASSAWSCGWP